VDRTSAHGLPDIITRMHGSATEADLTRWHYEGTQYIRQSCVTVESADADDKLYKEPKLTPHPCSIEGN
jgi:hypothetical protein